MAKSKRNQGNDDPIEGHEESEELPQLTKPADMPRACFERIKKAHEEADALDRRALVELLDHLTAPEEAADAHPAEAEFEKLLGLNENEGE